MNKLENSIKSSLNKNEVKEQLMKEKKSSLMEWVRFGLFLLFLVIVIPRCIGLTNVSGFSMLPTLQDGNWVLEEKVSKYFNEPNIGDVVTINEPQHGYKIIKRVMGLPGDTVEIKEGVIYVNQTPIPEITTEGVSVDMVAVTIPDEHIFVVGDNRTAGESIDSRDSSVGPIHMDNLEGYVVFSLKPFQSIPKPISLD
ncbi:signal peptidase I [Neobacillus niacini]|uniref:signal peptidase I n=1 Tax=Neobacillus niacini TaxID=86668 RepID=UPI003983CBF4